MAVQCVKVSMDARQGARMGMEKKPMLIEIHSLLKYICNKLGNLREREIFTILLILYSYVQCEKHIYII